MSFYYYPTDPCEYSVPAEYYIDASGYPQRVSPRRQPSTRSRRAQPGAVSYTSSNEFDLYDLARREAMRRAALQARHEQEEALEKERQQERERRRRAQAEAERQAAYKAYVRQRQLAIEREQAEKIARAEERARRERQLLENIRHQYAQAHANAQLHSADPFESLVRALSPFPVAFVESPENEKSTAKGEKPEPQAQVEVKSIPFFNSDATAETVASSDEDDAAEGTHDTFVDVTPVPEAPKVEEPAEPVEPARQSSEPVEVTSVPVEEEPQPETRSRRKEVRSRTDDDSEPRHKHHRQRKHRSQRRRSNAKDNEETDAHNIALLDVLHTELVHLSNVYTRISTSRATDNLSIAKSLLQVLEDTQLRTETVYNKLDNFKVPRRLRNVKHDLTKGSVELADKLDDALARQRKIVAELSAQAKSSTSNESDESDSSESDSSNDSFKSAPNRTPKHHVSMEEVRDASDY